VIACYRVVSAVPKRVTAVACRTSELLDRRGKQTADAAFGLNDPQRAWMGLQLGDATAGSAHRCCGRTCRGIRLGQGQCGRCRRGGGMKLPFDGGRAAWQAAPAPARRLRQTAEIFWRAVSPNRLRKKSAPRRCQTRYRVLLARGGATSCANEANAGLFPQPARINAVASPRFCRWWPSRSPALKPAPVLVLAGLVERLGIARSSARTGLRNVDLHVSISRDAILSVYSRAGCFAASGSTARSGLARSSRHGHHRPFGR
jgi:hypothetical protein